MAEQGRAHHARFSREFWALTLLFFVVGDILTTAVGLSLGAVELNPLLSPLIEEFVLLAMVPLKLAALVLSYGAWLLLSHDHCVLIPGSLAVIGILVTAWNLRIIMVLL